MAVCPYVVLVHPLLIYTLLQVLMWELHLYVSLVALTCARPTSTVYAAAT